MKIESIFNLHERGVIVKREALRLLCTEMTKEEYASLSDEWKQSLKEYADRFPPNGHEDWKKILTMSIVANGPNYCPPSQEELALQAEKAIANIRAIICEAER